MRNIRNISDAEVKAWMDRQLAIARGRGRIIKAAPVPLRRGGYEQDRQRQIAIEMERLRVLRLR